MYYKSIFISDIHLGAKEIHANELCDFLKNNTCDNLFLVGDIIDGWKLRRRWYWPQEYSNVIRKILTKAKRGTNVYYLVGNHDEYLRKFLGPDTSLGNITILDYYDYIGIDNKKYLIIHGDFFDKLMIDKKWLMHFGDWVDDAVVWINLRLNTIRGWLGKEYWSLSKWLKDNTSKAAKYSEKFELYLFEYCKEKEYDGIVCGHIHIPEIREIDNVKYMNCGDWYDNATAIVEHINGEWELIKKDS